MNILLVYQQGFSQELSQIEDFYDSHNLQTRERSKLKSDLYQNKDLVVVLGGDGTFLRASHYNKDVPMFGINPNPDRKEGYYMQTTINNFKTESPTSDQFNTRQLLRLSVHINRETVPELALNDVYIGDAKPYNMFNYDIKVNGSSELQRSSGVLVGTPSGSSGWIGSAGLEINQQNKFGFVARELYEGKLTPDYELQKGLLNRDQIIEITAKTPAIVVLDSVSSELKLNEGDTVSLTTSSHPLQYVT